MSNSPSLDPASNSLEEHLAFCFELGSFAEVYDCFQFDHLFEFNSDEQICFVNAIVLLVRSVIARDPGGIHDAMKSLYEAINTIIPAEYSNREALLGRIWKLGDICIEGLGVYLSTREFGVFPACVGEFGRQITNIINQELGVSRENLPHQRVRLGPEVQGYQIYAAGLPRRLWVQLKHKGSSRALFIGLNGEGDIRKLTDIVQKEVGIYTYAEAIGENNVVVASPHKVVAQVRQHLESTLQSKN